MSALSESAVKLRSNLVPLHFLAERKRADKGTFYPHTDAADMAPPPHPSTFGAKYSKILAFPPNI